MSFESAALRTPGTWYQVWGLCGGAESPIPGLSKGKPLSEENTPLEDTDSNKGGFHVTFILKFYFFFFFKKEKASIDTFWPLASF